MMLVQQELISRVREMCVADSELDAALMYGSFAQGVGDEFSDIEFWLFFDTDHMPDGRQWCRRIAPTLAVTVNEFGSHVVFFEGLIRGELHFATVADLAVIAEWPALGASASDLIVVDRRGELRKILAKLPDRLATPTTGAEIGELCLRFANWLVLAMHVTQRGEVLRAQDALNHARRYLLWMARLRSGATDTWLTPSRRVELELPGQIVRELHETIDVDPAASVRTCWWLGRELWRDLAAGHNLEIPTDLWAAIDEQVGR
jgi:lincosamide nucleotidyltransferase